MGGGGWRVTYLGGVADGVEGHEVRVDLALPVGNQQDSPSDGQIRHRIQESQMMGARAAA